MLISAFHNFIDYQTEFDSKIVSETIEKKYWNFLQLLGIYSEIKTIKGRIITLVTVLFESFLITYFGTCYVMTVIKSIPWNVPYAFFIGNCALVAFITLMCFLPTLWKRREISLIHYFISIRFFQYALEIHSSSTDKMINLIKIMRKYIIIMPVFVLGCISAVAIFNPRVEEEYVNGMDTSLLFITWSPFCTKSWTPYIIFTILQVALYALVACLATILFVALVETSLEWVIQMMKLIESIKSIEDRAIHQFKILHRDPYKVDHAKIYNNHKFIECYICCIKENIKHHEILIR